MRLLWQLLLPAVIVYSTSSQLTAVPGYDSATDSPEVFATSTECCSDLVMEGLLDADDYCKVIDVCNPVAPTEKSNTCTI